MQVGPVLLHTKQGVAAAGKLHLIIIHQGVQKGFQRARVRAALEHSRVSNQPPPDHHGIQTGILGLQGIDFGKRADISVETQRISAVFHGIGEPFPVHLAFIKLFPHPRVDGQLPDGIAVVQLQNGGKFLCRFQSQPVFYGNGKGRTGKYFVKKPLQFA